RQPLHRRLDRQHHRGHLGPVAGCRDRLSHSCPHGPSGHARHPGAGRPLAFVFGTRRAGRAGCLVAAARVYDGSVQRTTTSLGFIAVVATLGCGSSVTNDDITGTGGSTSSAGSGGATTGAGGASSSSGSTGGSGGVGGLDCPDIACTTACPGAIWPELDGCPLCACAADLELVVDGVPRPVQHLGLSVVASESIGGIDRWIFDFTWHYDDPLASDDE